MITVPQVAVYNNSIAIFRDDEDCNLFYPIRTRPKLRTENGRPVFSSLFWNDYNATTEEGKARLAGAEISFDVHLGLTKKEEEDVIRYIKSSGIQDQIISQMKEEQQEMDNARKQFTEGSGMDVKMSGFKRNMVKGEIRLGGVHYTTGKVFLNEEANGSLVQWSSAVNGAKPSLFGDNNAACKLTLKDIGAEVWYRTLQNKSRKLSVGFELEFPVRLPALEVIAYAGTYQKEFTEHDIKVLLQKVDKGCGKVDVEKIDIGEITQTFRDQGLINVEVKPGAATISDECMSEVRQGMMSILQKKIESIILNRFQGMELKENDATIIGKITQEMKAFTEIHYTQQEVMPMTIAPQCTMMDFLEGIPDDMWDKMLTPIDLRDPVMAPRQIIKVSANAPWDHIYSVEIEARCGKSARKITLTDGKSEQDWTLGDGDSVLNPVTYTTTVTFKGRGGSYTYPEKTCYGDIHVNVGRVGEIDVLFKPHPNLKNLTADNEVTTIDVKIDYEGRDGNMETYHLLVPTDQAEGVSFKRFVGRALSKPLQYTVNYTFKAKAPITIDTRNYDVAESDNLPIYTPFPYSDSLNLVFAVSDPDEFTTADRIYIEVDYQDNKNNYSNNGSAYLRNDNNWESRKISFPVIDRSVDAVKYQFTIYGDVFYQSPWLEACGNAGTIILPIDRLVVLCSQLGIGTDFMYGELTIDSTDGKFHKKKILDSKTGDRLDLYLQGGAEAPKEFTYKLMLIDMDGNDYKLEDTFSSSILVLKKPKQD